VRDVVVTGVGVVSALGNDWARLRAGLRAGRSGVAPLTRFDASGHTCRVAAEVDAGDLRLPTPLRHETERMDRFVAYALSAAGEALAQAGLDASGAAPAGGGVFVGVGMGGLPHVERGVLRQTASGPRKTSPYLIPSLVPGMAAGMVALAYGVDGPQLTLGSACSSGVQALGEAAWAIRAGRLEWALAGGSEGVITPITFSGFQAMRALTRRPAGETPRPFDRGRDGMAVGEGAGLFVLESRERAERRGALPLGRIAGYASVSGGHGIALVSGAAGARCMRAALDDAGLDAGEVDAVFARGAGLVRCDEQELHALREVFGAPDARPAVTSTEGHLGHTFGASGPLALAAALGALEDQVVPPTLHCEALPEGLESVDVVRAPRTARLRNCLVNTFGFGGANASLVCALP
jgi:3-oxoacyl-[acyl-carrier-protein] synthase II